MPLFKYHGCVLKEYDLEFLQLRTKETKKEFPQRNPSLMQSNDDFFDDNVEKVYDHDYLHELYAFHDRPLFESLKQEDKLETAWCEKDKWEELSYEDKCKCCAEETYVISTERFIIPSEWDFAYRRAYFRSLQKVCTTLTSGWFRDFAIDNYPEIVALYDAQRFDHVKDMLAQEKVA